MLKIAPSILSADFSKLGEQVKMVEAAGADYLHIDVMDGHFVPNITIGSLVVKAIKPLTNLFIDVHLMIEHADNYIDDFVDMGADIISVHVESSIHLYRTIQKIKQRGIKAAVALNPATSLDTIKWIMNDIDMVLLMSVNPGFGGQKYIDCITKKIKELKKLIDERKLNIDIEVDGGIDLNNIGTIKKAGANVIVSGTTIFCAENKKEVIKKFREA